MVEFSLPKNLEPARIRILNEKGLRSGKYVLYWMQQSQRAEDNHALEATIEVANLVDLPLLVVFGLTDAYPDANLRHYTFMLEGLQVKVYGSTALRHTTLCAPWSSTQFF